jgi:hypothetical protein
MVPCREPLPLVWLWPSSSAMDDEALAAGPVEDWASMSAVVERKRREVAVSLSARGSDVRVTFALRTFTGVSLRVRGEACCMSIEDRG